MGNNLISEIKLYPGEGFEGPGSMGKPTGNGVSGLASIISRAIGIMTIVAIIWFVFTFVLGVIGIIGSGGDKQALESARKKITTGAIGLLVVILALVIISLIGRFVGISNILDINTLFNLIPTN